MDQQIDKGSAEHGKFLGEILGNALGGDLAEDQHQNGDRHRGIGGADIAVKLYEQQGGDRGHGDVHNVVADQNGGNELVVIVCQTGGKLCPAVAAVR